MRIRVNGILINYEINGRGGNLVLIHGAGDNLNMWYHQVPVLSQSFRIIAYDIRGHGETESPDSEYSIPLFVGDAYELMKAIGVDEACFLGYSMGGAIALGLAFKHPEMVKALILANTPVGSPLSRFFLERQRSNQELLDKGDLKTVAENMAADAFSPGFGSKNPVEFERYLKVKLQNKVDSMARLTRSFGALRGGPELQKIQCPVLIIQGEKDVYMDIGQMKQAQAKARGPKWVTLPTGHASAIELPGRFNSAVLDFLSPLSLPLPAGEKVRGR